MSFMSSTQASRLTRLVWRRQIVETEDRGSHTIQLPFSTEAALERDKFMSAEEAVKFGLIDQVVEHRKGTPLVAGPAAEAAAAAAK